MVPTSFHWRRTGGYAASTLLACSIGVAAEQQLSVGQVRIAPHGDRVLAIATNGVNRVLAVSDLASGERNIALRSGPGQSLGACAWISDERIVCEVFAFAEQKTAPFSRRRVVRLVAVDHDGQHLRQLLDTPPRKPPRLGGKRRGIGNPLADLEHKLVHRLPSETDRILISASRVATPYTTVYRVDTHTGQKKRVVRWQQGILFWHADWQGRVRLGTGGYAFGDIVGEPWMGPAAVAAAGEGDWKPVDVADLSIPIGHSDMMGPRVLGFSADGQVVYLDAAVGGANRVALWAADATTLKPIRELKAHPERDVHAMAIGARGCGIVGFAHSLPGDPFTWLDQEFGDEVASASIGDPQAKLVAIPSMSDDCRKLVLASTDERTYIRFHVLDRTTGEVRKVGGRDVGVADRNASRREMVRFETRDGYRLPMALTLPTPGDGIAPTVILLDEPNTNPERLDTWPHYFASRGFAVAQPAFRGVRGYGAAFQMAGRRMEAAKLQDDIMDALSWLSRHGLADTSRTCFAGRGRGGHLALAASLAMPDGLSVRRCAAAYAVRGTADTKRRVDEPLDYRVCGWFPCGDWESWAAQGHAAIRFAASHVPERYEREASTLRSPVPNAPHPGFPILIKTSGDAVVHESGSRRYSADIAKTGFIDHIAPEESAFEREFLHEAANLFDEVLLGAERTQHGGVSNGVTDAESIN